MAEYRSAAALHHTGPAASSGLLWSHKLANMPSFCSMLCMAGHLHGGKRSVGGEGRGAHGVGVEVGLY
jgi:hypothetical protein